MSIQVFGPQAVVSTLNRGLLDQSPSYASYQSQLAAATADAANGYANFAKSFFVGTPMELLSNAALSHLVLSNMGVSNALVEQALTDYFAGPGASNRGLVILQLGNILSGLEGDATFGAAAAAWNAEIAASNAYSSNPEHTTPGVVHSNDGDNFVFTGTQDTFVGGAGDDTFTVDLGTVGVLPVSTLQSYDSASGGDGNDTLNIFNRFGFNELQVGTFSGIENVNIYNGDGEDDFQNASGVVDASKFAGVTQLWQIDGASSIVKLDSATTAGFRNLTSSEEEINIDAAAGSQSITIQLDHATGHTIDFDVHGLSMNTVNLSGDISYIGEDDCGLPVVKEGEVSLDVHHGSGSTFTLNSSLNVDLWVSGSEADNSFSVLAAAASTGDITFDGEDHFQTITTGSGNDDVELNFLTSATKNATVTTNAGDDQVGIGNDGAGTTTVNTGAGNDEINVWNTSKTLVVNAGEGDDELNLEGSNAFWWWEAPNWSFETEGSTETTAVTVDMGAGNDDVEFGGLIMADLPAAWHLDGGAGTDSVFLGAGVGRDFNAGDYITLTENLVNFEEVTLWAGEDQDFTLDASRLSNYKHIGFLAQDGVDVTVTKVAADQTIAMSNDTWSWWWGNDATLDVTAAGYSAAGATTVFGGPLNVEINTNDWWWWGSGSVDVTARGDTLNLKVDTEDFGWTTVDGDVKTLNVTLNAEVQTEGDCVDHVEHQIDVGTEFVGVWIDTHNFDMPHGNALTTLNLSGVGEAVVFNRDGDSLATVNAAGLTNIDWNGTKVVSDAALEYWTDNAGVKETITLGGSQDFVTFGTLATSTYAKMDTVTGLNLVDNAAVDGTQVDVLKSDIIDVVGLDAVKLGSTLAGQVSAAGSLGLALQTVAQSGTYAAVFSYGGNTYIFADTVTSEGADQLDDGDMVIKITGNVDLTLLAELV